MVRRLAQKKTEVYQPRYAVIGGGITGVNCTLALSGLNCHVDLYEKASLLKQTSACVRRVNITGFHYKNIADQVSVAHANRKWMRFLLDNQPYYNAWVEYEHVSYFILESSEIDDASIDKLIASVQKDYISQPSLQLPGVVADQLIVETNLDECTHIPKGVYRHFRVLEARVRMGSCRYGVEGLAIDLIDQLDKANGVSVYQNFLVDRLTTNDVVDRVGLVAHDVFSGIKRAVSYDMIFDCSNSYGLTKFQRFSINGLFKFTCMAYVDDAVLAQAMKLGSCLNVWSSSGWGISIVPEDKCLILTAEEVTKCYQRRIKQEEHLAITKEVFAHISSMSDVWKAVLDQADPIEATIEQNYISKPSVGSMPRGVSHIENVHYGIYKCYVDKLANAHELAQKVVSMAQQPSVDGLVAMV